MTSTPRHILLLLSLYFCLLVTSLRADPATKGADLPRNSDVLGQWKVLVAEKETIDQAITQKVDALRMQVQKATPQERRQIMTAFSQLQNEFVKKYENLFQKMRPLAAKLEEFAAPLAAS